eukprot:g18862.t1
MFRNKDAIRTRWQSLYHALLYSESPNMKSYVVRQVTQWLAPPTTGSLGAAPDLQEEESGAKALCNWKPSGPDLIPAELLKIDDDDDDDDDEPIVLKRHHAIMVDVWNSVESRRRSRRKPPSRCCTRKGDRSNCNNFRGISVLSHVGKVLAEIVTHRLGAFCEADDILPEEQCGFRPGRSMVCMLFVVRRLQKLGRRRRIPLYMCFIDPQKAYYRSCCERRRRDRGGRRRWNKLGGRGVVSQSADGLARMMTVVVEVFREFGLTVSERKTETMVMRVKEKRTPQPPPLIMEAAGQRYTPETELRYLGGLVTQQGDLTREINHRSKAAWACIRRKGTHRQLSYAQARKGVDCQSVEATIRQQRLLFVGDVARQLDGQLPKCLIFGELAGGENLGKGSSEQNWLICLKDDLKAFGATTSRASSESRN